MLGALLGRNMSQKLSVLLLVFGLAWGLLLLHYTVQQPRHQSSAELREQILELSRRYVKVLTEENENAPGGLQGTSMAGYADLKRTIAVLLEDILTRLVKLEGKIELARRKSRSRSYSPEYRRKKSQSTSPNSNRRRHTGSRANPDPSTCLGVFGLSLYTTERDLREVFSRHGPLAGVNVVYDQRTGRSRGFAFVYYERIDDSKEAMERANGMELDGRRIRVDYSITKRAHTPTPGIYMGRPTQ
ncbi:Transformer-2 alpha [Liparis tanakae]|uniref:Transformer-2 protein homolog alpha n=1 Tax=Liparis tanakae TaxID=230148 RepID=A0A4Z2I2Y8_9TELE|nr:Transformer-2 alpha [Liparis tanakae]